MSARLREWILVRMETCRTQEQKFGGAWTVSSGKGSPQALVEAWTERQTLQQVLDVLDEPRREVT